MTIIVIPIMDHTPEDTEPTPTDTRKPPPPPLTWEERDRLLPRLEEHVFKPLKKTDANPDT